MNEISAVTKQTMSSLEIADIVSSRHDHVKKSIERLVESGAISKPPVKDGEKSANGVVIKYYLLEKRDSYVVVAQLSPTFTGKLVDRWQELEAKQAPALQALPSYAETLRLYADSMDKIQEKDKLIVATNQAQIAAGEILVREFVKANDLIELGEKQFFHWMRDNGIISESNEPYQKHVKQGYFTWKPTEEMHGGKFRYQMRITPRGKVWLAAKYMAYLDEQ